MKKWISGLLAAAMAASCVPTAVLAKSENFSDVTGTEYYATAADALYELDILEGYEDGRFIADSDITRAEMSAVICRMLGMEDEAENAEGATEYDDVSSNHWASGYINVATEEGIIEGDGNGRFRPEDNVKHEEALKMVVCALGLADNVHVDPNDWSAEYLEIADDNNITDDLTSSKGRPAPRGDVAVMVYNGLTMDLEAPTASKEGGNYTGTQRIELSTATDGAEIYYTTDGSTPTADSTKYTGTITISRTTTLKAVSVLDGVLTSDEFETEYTIRTSSGGGGGGSSIARYTVSFDLNYEGAAETVESQTVSMGETVEFPGIPSREGYAFVGWYLDRNEENIENIFDFSNTGIEHNTTLFAKWINTSVDTDGDMLVDDLEIINKTDINNPDTDGDGLSDYVEVVVLGTDPLQIDTDGDGVLDIDEDTDNDALTNLEEIAANTNLVGVDTDNDGLTDGQEVKEYGTDPLKEDTDGDKASDNWEINNGFNPCVANVDFDVEKSVDSVNVTASASIRLPGEQAETISVSAVTDNAYLDSSLPGYIDVPFEFSLEGEFPGTAKIEFGFDKGLMDDPNFVPAIYYFNEETLQLEELNTTVDFAAGLASAVVTHFSTYILLNKTEFDKVWDNEIKPPIAQGESENHIAVALVIDSSGSMSSNDPNDIRISVAKSFASKLGKNDVATVIDFDSNATLLTDFTSDQQVINDAILKIDHSGGTNLGRGIDVSLQQFDNYDKSDSAYKMVIMLTDGDGSYNDELTLKAAEEGIIIYTIGLGSDIDEELLRAIADGTSGKYYYASQADELETIFDEVAEETVDLVTDSNNDGIPDYYTRLLCDSDSYVNGAKNPFYSYSYEEIQKNADYDGDGLKNGEEFIITSINEVVYAKMVSDPMSQNSDSDPYSDYDEIKKYHSEPMKGNVSFDQNDLDFLINDDNFISNKYKEFYENPWTGESVAVWIANNIFGSKYDTTYLYKSVLMDYLKRMVDENEEVAQTRKIIDMARKYLSVMKDAVDEANKNYVGDTTDMLENLQQQIETANKNFDDLTNGDLLNNGYTREKVYEMFDDVRKQYSQAAEKTAELKKNLEVTDKISKTTEAFGVVLDVVDIGFTAKDFFDNYSEFSAQISGMEDCVCILDRIKNSSDAPDELKQACSELIVAIEKKSTSNLDTFFDGLRDIGGKVIRVGASHAVTFIPVVGPYLEAINVAMGLIDFAFNISGVAEQCTYLYAISKSSTILAYTFNSEISGANKYKYWRNVYNDYSEKANTYLGLAIMRRTSETKMEEANRANTWIIEWLFTEIMYKSDNINDNINKIDDIKYNYIAAGI